jgi:protocatechuate 3,4-dioxygenase beta subunit
VPTPSCEEETESDIEGPFYTENAPVLSPDASGRAVLSPSMPGERIVLTGRVLAVGCTPLAGAELDLWQADEAGVYDNVGYTLRGRVLTASDGSFAISTVLPGRYLNGSTYRPRHLHLKLRAAGHRLLTTQLYFPGDPFNESDAFFDARLMVNDVTEDGERYARFDFVLAPV